MPLISTVAPTGSDWANAVVVISRAPAMIAVRNMGRLLGWGAASNCASDLTTSDAGRLRQIGWRFFRAFRVWGDRKPHKSMGPNKKPRDNVAGSCDGGA